MHFCYPKIKKKSYADKLKNNFRVCEHKLKIQDFPGFGRPFLFLDIYFCPIFKRGFTFQQKYLIF